MILRGALNEFIINKALVQFVDEIGCEITGDVLGTEIQWLLVEK